MISFDGFLDTYYSRNFKNPVISERAYTTQAVRQNEPNINLAYGGLTFNSDMFRARLALQAGNSVKANTIYEANPELGFIQESYAGIKISSRTWIDAGIYLGNIGMESWISKNNMTYTRSMLLDYVPYYSLGARVTHEPDEKTHLEFHLLNGWQNISETNSSKAIGVQYKKNFERWTFTYNNFLGDEKVLPGQRDRFRTYHNFIGEIDMSGDFRLQGSFDFGTQASQGRPGTDFWWAQAVTIQKKINAKNFVAGRIEYYADPQEANVRTNNPKGFRVFSSSVNFDHYFSSDFISRIEIKGFSSREKLYPKDDQGLNQYDGFIVTSLSLSL
jgi:Putative beta-barrel porin-2, OmpL-like. bbp2